MKKIWKRLWARKYSPLLASAFTLSYIKNRRFGASLNKLFVPEGKLMACYYEEHEFRKLSDNYEKFLKKQELKKYALTYEREFIDFLEYAKKTAKIDPRKLARKEISGILGKFTNRLIQSSDHQFYAFLVLEGVASRLEEKILKMPNGHRILEIITSPYKLTKITKSQIELLKIAKNNDPVALRRHAEQYAWLPAYDPLDDFWTLKDFKKLISSIKDPETEIKKYQNNEKLQEYKKYFSSIKDRELKKEIEIVHYFSYLKEMRDDYRRHAYFLLRPFFKKLAEVLSISYREINHMSLQEIMRSVESGELVIPKKELKQRQVAFAIVLDQGRLTILSGKKAIALGKQLVKKSGSAVTGRRASPGRATGRVSVVYHQGEFAKFKQGDILVTTMTHPEFLPIMKMAKAIVTDEGGITCHAAIVSRELGIPCIIGTKIATQILKDGDLVEVDANKGIVRKVK